MVSVLHFLKQASTTGDTGALRSLRLLLLLMASSIGSLVFVGGVSSVSRTLDERANILLKKDIEQHHSDFKHMIWAVWGILGVGA